MSRKTRNSNCDIVLIALRNFVSALTLSDEKGTLMQISSLLFVLLVMGSLLSLIVHIIFPTINENENVTKRYNWVEPFSSSLGYTYFLSWSLSFYPQVILNYKRKQTSGLSVDFCLLNVLGFLCYSIYNVAFFWSKTIQALYVEKHDYYDEQQESNSVIMVQGNDVAFALHAFVLSSFTYAQILYYSRTCKNGCQLDRAKFEKVESGMGDQISPLNDDDSEIHALPSTICFVTLVIVGGVLYGLAIVFDNKEEEVFPIILEKYLNWLDFCYALSTVKVMITIFKYVPQVILNIQRKSTEGWTIWMVVLDLYGGVLSVTQLLLDCWNSRDWDGIFGNMAKFLLGFVSIFFDLVFILQHYVLYRDNNEYEKSNEDETKLEGTPLFHGNRGYSDFSDA